MQSGQAVCLPSLKSLTVKCKNINTSRCSIYKITYVWEKKQSLDSKPRDFK